MKKSTKKKTKKNTKKNSFWNKVKNKLKGFTLVELLAVIVILAIIMVIAIPSVMETLTTAKEKSFTEYMEKVYMKATEKQVTDVLTNSSNTCTIYNIDEMFGSTGSYEGFIMVLKKGGTTKYYLTMWDGEYMVTAYEYNGTISVSDLQDYTNAADERLTKGYLVTKADSVSCVDSSNNQVYYTGNKEVTSANGNWTAHYTNGVMDKCYVTKSNTTTLKELHEVNGKMMYMPFVMKGGEEYYCTGTSMAAGSTTCSAKKSLECCTGSTTSYSYTAYYPDNEICGYFMAVYADGSNAMWTGELYTGGGLPATSYTG